VYTGQQTKIFSNLGQFRFKQSSFEKRTNIVYVFNVFLIALICLLMAVGNYISTSRWVETKQYIFPENDGTKPIVTSVFSFFSFYLLVYSFLPLELIMSVEVIKLCVAYFIEQDSEMIVADYETGTLSGFRAQSLNLIEDLAEVEYLFCDKTGTLTQN